MSELTRVPAKIRAAVLTGPGTIELQTFARPSVGPDSGLLAVVANGICGSDVDWRRKGAGGPLILGHEVVGTIAEIGHRAAERWRVRPGQLVAVEAGIRCGSCRGCRSGAGCTAAGNYGATIGIDVVPSLWGGLAEYMYLAPGTVLTPLPDRVPGPVAAGWFSPLANAVDWVGPLGADVQPGDTVVVLGPGPQGLAGVLVARARGAGSIILVGLRSDSARLAAGRRLGADHILHADEVDVLGAVGDLTAGELADSVLDVSGHIPSAALAPLLVRRGGAVSAASPVTAGAVASMPLAQMVLNQVRWHGMRSNRPAAAPAAASLLARHVEELDALVTHRFGLADAAAAIDAVERGDIDGVAPVKVVVCP